MKKFQSLSVVYLLMGGAVITSCTDDKVDGPLIPTGEGEQIVQLAVRDQGIGTRAYTGTHPMEPGENQLADQLSVYVFDLNGAYSFQKQDLSFNPLTGITDTFKVSAGEKYFYIFSNAQDKRITDLTKNWSEFEKQEIWVSFKENKPVHAADSNAMAIGTLWRGQNKHNIEPDLYGGNPIRIGLDVGRAVAKVRLVDIKKETVPGTSPLKGTFTDPIYRLRSVGTKYYLVGQLDDSGDYPPTTGLRYYSCLHAEGPGTTAVPSTYFVDYFWEYARKPGQEGNPSHFYAIENTTQMMTSENVKDEHLYYGNTTYVQFQIQYTPDNSEVYDINDPATLLTTGFTGPDFWTAEYNGERRIYNEDPALASDPTVFGDPETIKHYIDGRMYYKFPIRDPRETGTERQCCVIRNHYYEINVNNIFNLGEPTDFVDREEPIDDSDGNVEVHITVLEWFKVEQGEDL